MNLSETPKELPKDKKSLIVMVCRQFGIPLSYTPRGHNKPTDITEENIGEFHNLDFLLTNRSALVTLLRGANHD